LNIPWLADFRDPWTNIDYYRDLKLGKAADRKHHELEKKVLQSADAVTVVSPGMKKDFQAIHNREYEVIPNGYDAADLEDIPDIKASKDKFILAHIGSLTKTRNPENLWQSLRELCNENREFEKALEIHNVGKMDFRVKDAIKNAGLESKLVSRDYLPHDEVLTEQRKANALLLLVNDTPNAKLILTGKLFEYLAARRPVICIGPADGDAAKVIMETGSGKTFGFDETAGLKGELLQIFKQYRSVGYVAENKNVEKYERKNLTKRMGQVLNSCVASRQVSG
jgi:glycosyltransferase involved in cell wall biosynthesis